jgi:hypothetical protein
LTKKKFFLTVEEEEDVEDDGDRSRGFFAVTFITGAVLFSGLAATSPLLLRGTGGIFSESSAEKKKK